MHQARLATVFLLAVVAGLALVVGAEPPAKSPPGDVASTLEAARPVPCKLLTETGRLLAPRPDTVVPAGLVALLNDESIVRIYPWPAFQMEAGHPTWRWTLWNNSGVRGQPQETEDRLVGRLLKMGFQPVASTDERYPLAFQREIAPGDQAAVVETVLLENPASWVGGREPAVGIELEWTVRSGEKRPPPTLAEVLAAMPSLRPPQRGKHTIPDEVLAQLSRERVTEVALEGPGTTWYALNVVLPGRSHGTAPPVVARIEAALKKEGFVPEKLAPPPPGEPPILDLIKRDSGGTANCRVKVYPRGEGLLVTLFVQTGAAP